MVSVIVPVFNEADILEETVERLMGELNKLNEEFEIIIAENGSTDSSLELAEQLCQKNSKLRVLHVSDRAPGTAFARAVHLAKGEKLISLDADLSSELFFIETALQLLKHCDMVVGSKTLGNQDRSLFRILGSQFYIALTQILFGLTVTDYSIGVKAYRKNAIEPIVDKLDSWTGYVFEICLFMRLQNMRLIQVGVECVDLRNSHFNLAYEAFHRFSHLFRVWFKLKTGRHWLMEN